MHEVEQAGKNNHQKSSRCCPCRHLGPSVPLPKLTHLCVRLILYL